MYFPLNSQVYLNSSVLINVSCNFSPERIDVIFSPVFPTNSANAFFKSIMEYDFNFGIKTNY